MGVLDLAQLGAQFTQRLLPGLSQLRNFVGVVEADDDFFLEALQITQGGAQLPGVGDGLHLVLEQTFQRHTRVVQCPVAQQPDGREQHQREDGTEVQPGADRDGAQF